MRNFSVFAIGILGLVFFAVTASADGNKVSVSGTKAAAVVHALQQANLPSAGGEDGVQFNIPQIDCQVSAATDQQMHHLTYAQCLISVQGAKKAQVFSGKTAARIQLALEAAGATNDNGMGKRGISVSGLAAQILSGGDDSATASFTDVTGAND